MVQVGLNHCRQSVGNLLEPVVVQLEYLLSLLGVLRAVHQPSQSEEIHGSHRVGARLGPVLVILQSQDDLRVPGLAGEVSTLRSEGKIQSMQCPRSQNSFFDQNYKNVYSILTTF